MNQYYTAARTGLGDIVLFAEIFSSLRLRSYQSEAARVIVDSVIHHQGESFVVLFPRQSGKNELQAQIETYLLTLLQQSDAEIVKVSPTWKPQTLNAMRRLQRVLERNFLLTGRWSKESGYIFKVGRARIFFLSGSPTANRSPPRRRRGVAGVPGRLLRIVFHRRPCRRGATPCTAPFMATALGYALTQPAPEALLIFEALGLGMALPYLAIAMVPAWARLLPRPGAWMERLKQFLAFPLYGSAAWLLWVLSQQTGSTGLAAALAGLVLLSLALWLYEVTRHASGLGRVLGRAAAAASLIIAVALVLLAPTATRSTAAFARGRPVVGEPRTLRI